jgi:hypothetical protein
LALLSMLVLPAASSAAAPPHLLQIPGERFEPGSGAGEVSNPRGIGVDESTGHIYVADRDNARISEFTPWGAFVKAWGWGVEDGSSELQSCAPAEPEPDPPPELCRQGLEGAGAGQLGAPQGVTVDSLGNVYVYDRRYHRVTKYDSAGNFLLMFGGDVNRTKVEAGDTEAERNLCTAASGDVCQEGSLGPGKGQFAGEEVGNYIAAGPGDRIYVGDEGRIQRFSASGQFEAEIRFEGALSQFSGMTVKGLDADSAGDLYVVFAGLQDVYKLSPAGTLLPPAFPVENPRAVAVDVAGNVYVSQASGVAELNGVRVVGFDASGNLIIPPSEGFAAPRSFGEDSADLIGIAANIRCPGSIDGGVCSSTGIRCSEGAGSDVYVSRFNNGAISPPPRSYLDAYGQPPCFEDPPRVPPTIKSQFARSVSPEAAIVRAQINPHFWDDATYYVEYGTGECSKGGCPVLQPLPPGLPLTQEVVNATITTADVALTGLAPDTTYHYRFVARSTGGGPVRGAGGTAGDDGAEATFTTPTLPAEPKICSGNQAFRIGAGAYLPDCRAYEMVSPVDKDNGDILAFKTQAEHATALTQSATSGELFTYSTYRAFGDAQSAPYTSQYLASRNPAVGWSTTAISPRRESGSFFGDGGELSADREFKAFSADLCGGWLGRDSDPPLTADAPAGHVNIYRRDNCGPVGYEALVRSVPPNDEPQGTVPRFTPELQGFTDDGRCSVFRADDVLVVAGVPPSTAKAPNGRPIYQLYESCNGQLRLVSVNPGGEASAVGSSAGTVNTNNDVSRTSSLRHAVSSDGSRVYWTASEGLGGGRIYLRENATAEQSAVVGGECVEVGKACTVPVSETVSAGNAQFWTATVDGSRALFTIGEDLYEFDAGTGDSSLLAHGVKGVAGAGADLGRIYLVSTEALSGAQENSEGDKAVGGKPNLYLLSGGSFTYVAALSSVDAAARIPGRTIPSPVNVEAVRHSAFVTPDGSVIAFMSTGSPTRYDNTDADSGLDDAEVFVYEAATDELDCASCNPSGSRPVGRNFSFGATPFGIAARLPAYESALYAPRALSDDDARLFFESFEGLVPRDLNGKQDVYEWQRAATRADCVNGIGGEVFLKGSGACLGLISSGSGSSDSEFLDASPSGEDAFFSTGVSLVPQDPGLIDVYDARVGGGFPSPPPPPAECQGAECQGPSSVPNDPTPSSQVFHGPGNQAKKHHKKKHHKKHRHKKHHEKRHHRAPVRGRQ